MTQFTFHNWVTNETHGTIYAETVQQASELAPARWLLEPCDITEA